MILNNFRISDELSRLARFGANITDSYSCFLFLPASHAQRIVNNLSPVSSSLDTLHLVGCHTLSKDVIQSCALPLDAGLVGWVAKHGRSIHVSPFERDSRTLGVYHTDQQLKSFIGVPVKLELENESEKPYGVVACDSKKAFAFSKLQGKLIEDLAGQLSSIVNLALRASGPIAPELSWETFLASGSRFADTIGIGTVGMLKVKPINFDTLHTAIGIQGTLQLHKQVFRLIQQTLPPETPIFHMPTGELLIAVDNMMLSYFESRIEAVATYAAENGHRILFEYTRSINRSRRGAAQSFIELIEVSFGGERSSSETQPLLPTSQPALAEKGMYEYRRA